jgi:hypothetical protein
MNISFKSFIAESREGKSLHLEHIEEELFNRGVAGARDSILFLRSIRDLLAGHTPKSQAVTITTKFDGAPVIFAGINPDNGKFFVGGKAVFSKNAKLNYTEEDIERNYGHQPGMAKIMKLALEHFPKLGITGVLQGDMMFVRDELKVIDIEGQRYLSFQPNTIVYTVPLDSQLSHTMQRAHIGIVWHTQYKGDSLEGMQAAFLPNLNELNTTPDVWYRDARFIDASGSATFSAEETEHLTAILSAAGAIFQQINPQVLNYISINKELKNQILKYNNAQVRLGQGIVVPQEYLLNLIKNVTETLNKGILDSKLAPTRVRRQQEKNEYLKFYNGNFNELVKIFTLSAYIVRAKDYIIQKLKQVEGLGTFLRTEYGFKVTAPEGFVAVDHMGKAVKLVDRLEFSRANFVNTARAWDQ